MVVKAQRRLSVMLVVKRLACHNNAKAFHAPFTNQYHIVKLKLT